MKKLNVKLLRRVQRHILEEPRRLDMVAILESAADRDAPPHELPPCGTIGCIAGWAAKLTHPDIKNPDEVLDIAREELNLSRPKDFGPDPLFDLGGWPEKYRARYRAATSPTGRAVVTCYRIDHFIETGE